MPWEPTTRGTSQTKHICHYGVCREMNTRLDFYIVDHQGIRYFCDAHWSWVCFFFKLVKACSQCKRNYGAELYKDSRTKYTTKHIHKWWELCSHHWKILDDELCFFTDLDLPLYD